MDMYVGVIAPGNFAEVLLVTGDPTQDLTILQDKKRMPLVMKGGQLYRFDQEALHAGITHAARRAA
jgi:imidazolonepropionase-like amidohydrolase